MSGEAVAGGTAAEPVRRVASGWVTWWRFDDGLASVLARPELYRDVSLFWFRATRASDVVEQEPGSQPPEATLVAAVDQLQAAGVPVHLAVNDEGMNATVMARLLGDRMRRDSLVSALVQTVQRVGADGVDIDFESMNVGPSGADRTAVRKRFPVFLDRLRDRLHAQGLALSIALPPRSSGRDPSWQVFDYRAIGPTVDRARLMAYDYHVRNGRAGPIAPIGWVNDVARYASSAFGKRLSLGLPAYGYNWPVQRLSGPCLPGEPPPTFGSTRSLVAVARREGVRPRFVASAAGYRFTYRYRASNTCRVEREVWYEDARSVEAKLAVLRRHRIRSVALWELGGERTGTWKVLTAYAQR